MYGATSWDREAWEQERADQLARLQDRIDRLLIERQHRRWMRRHPRMGRDHLERAAEQAVAAPW
jgi:hypothetical protein